MIRLVILARGSRKAYDAFCQNEIKDVQVKLYENDRHEISE